MRPRSEADAVPVTREITLTPTLQLSAVGVTFNASGGSKKDTKVIKRSDVSIEALNEGTDHPRWAFYKTDSRQIRGIHTLCLVIDLPANTQGTASIGMSATIGMRHMNIFRFTAALAEIPQIATVNINPA
jgi:phosphoribosyl-dephospho-CoA transferase